MSKRKNICITINSLEGGGAEKQALLLAKALMKHHNPVLVIFSAKAIYAPRLEIIRKEGLEHIYLSKNSIKAFFNFKNYLKRKRTDIIFSFLPKDTVLAAVAGKITGVPYVFGGIRNSHVFWLKYKTLKWVNNHLLSYTISNNYAAYSSAIASGFKNKVFVIHNGIEIRPLSEKERDASKSITIISLGRLVKQKAYDTALKSIVQLKSILQKEYNLTYKIVGQGPEEDSIKNMISKLDLSKEVTLITNTNDIYQLLESSDIYLCTSTFEGLSNSIMEAMNCAMPIVATDAGDNTQLIHHEKNGYIAPINDFSKIAECLAGLTRSPELRYNMGLESYSHLRRNFSFKAFQKKYLDLIEHIDTIKIEEGNAVFKPSEENNIGPNLKKR